METAYLQSPLGPLYLEADSKGLKRLTFADGPLDHINTVSSANPHLRQAACELEEYFQGKRKRFECRLSPEGTVFQVSVWNRLQQIPFGVSKSYGQLAEELGNSGASRAVGSANNRNPIAIIIPCHRVVGSSQKLVGYAGGLWRKQWLLEHEGLCLPISQ